MFKKILAILALMLGGLVFVAPATPAAALVPTNWGACWQSQSYGNRVCFDETTAFGPVIVIYSNATAEFASFSVVNAVPGCNPFVATAAEWGPGANPNQTNIPAAAGRCNNAVPATVDGSLGCSGAPAFVVCVPNGANHDLLEWFANDPTMEFVWVN